MFRDDWNKGKILMKAESLLKFSRRARWKSNTGRMYYELPEIADRRPLHRWKETCW